MVLAPDTTSTATELVFADDARQANPTRPDMGPLVATGGLIIPADTCGWLETQVHQACADAGFPEGEEFKWSPRRGRGCTAA